MKPAVFLSRGDVYERFGAVSSLMSIRGLGMFVAERVVTLPVDPECWLEYEDMALPGRLGATSVASGASSSESEEESAVDCRSALLRAWFGRLDLDG